MHFQVQHAAALRVELEQGFLITNDPKLSAHISSVEKECLFMTCDLWRRAGLDHAELVLLSLFHRDFVKQDGIGGQRLLLHCWEGHNIVCHVATHQGSCWLQHSSKSHPT